MLRREERNDHPHLIGHVCDITLLASNTPALPTEARRYLRDTESRKKQVSSAVAVDSHIRALWQHSTCRCEFISQFTSPLTTFGFPFPSPPREISLPLLLLLLLLLHHSISP